MIDQNATMKQYIKITAEQIITGLSGR